MSIDAQIIGTPPPGSTCCRVYQFKGGKRIPLTSLGDIPVRGLNLAKLRGLAGEGMFQLYWFKVTGRSRHVLGPSRVFFVPFDLAADTELLSPDLLAESVDKATSLADEEACVFRRIWAPVPT